MLTIVFKLYVFSYCITIVLSARTYLTLIASLQVILLRGIPFYIVPCRQQNWVALNRVCWLLLSCGGWYHSDIIRGVTRRGANAVVTCNAVGCYRLEQVVCVLQLTRVNCTRWTHAPVLCATACTVTCPTCGSTCASSTTLRVSLALYVTSHSRPSCT